MLFECCMKLCNITENVLVIGNFLPFFFNGDGP